MIDDDGDEATVDGDEAGTIRASKKTIGVYWIWVQFAFLPMLAFTLSLKIPHNYATAICLIGFALPMTMNIIFNAMNFTVNFGTSWSLFAVFVAEILSLIYFYDEEATFRSSCMLIGGQLVALLASVSMRSMYVDDDEREDFLNVLIKSLIVLLVFGTVLTYVASKVSSEVGNPFRAGSVDQSRFIILGTKKTGHSIASEALLVIAGAVIFRKAKFSIGSLALIGICLLILTLTKARLSLCYCALICLALVFKAGFLSSFQFAISCLAVNVLVALLISSGPTGFLMDAIGYMQEVTDEWQITDGGRKEISNGRAELNEALYEVFVTHPIMGVGYDHPLLSEGLKSEKGFGAASLATSESALRGPAGRGLLVLIPTLIFYFRGLFLTGYRGSSFIMFIIASTLSHFLINGGLERISGPLDIWYFVFATIAWELTKKEDESEETDEDDLEEEDETEEPAAVYNAML